MHGLFLKLNFSGFHHEVHEELEVGPPATLCRRRHKWFDFAHRGSAGGKTPILASFLGSSGVKLTVLG